MPLVGFIGTSGERFTFEQALDLADSDEFPYPRPLMSGIIDAQQNRGDYISATSILHCLRNEFLTRNEDYYSTVDSTYAAFRGTLFHALMEKHAEGGARIEEKHTRKHKGVEIGGTFDSLRLIQDGDMTILEDWKTTKELPKYGAYSSHIKQVNLYRWLLKLDPEKTLLVVWYFSMEGVKRCELSRGGKTKNGSAKRNDIMTDRQIELFLDDRLIKLKASFNAHIPLPYFMVPEDDKWLCAYCPVKAKCDTLALDEQQAAWARGRGDLPDPDNDSNSAAVWSDLLDGIKARMEAA